VDIRRRNELLDQADFGFRVTRIACFDRSDRILVIKISRNLLHLVISPFVELDSSGENERVRSRNREIAESIAQRSTMPIEIINPDAEGGLSPILFVTRRQLRDSHRAMSHAIPILDARTDRLISETQNDASEKSPSAMRYDRQFAFCPSTSAEIRVNKLIER